jgi:hypothetical protein
MIRTWAKGLEGGGGVTATLHAANGATAADGDAIIANCVLFDVVLASGGRARAPL